MRIHTLKVYLLQLVVSVCVLYLLTSSKHDGLAGTRFGWGLYQDPELASGVARAVSGLMLGLSVDAQLRVLSSLQEILSK